MTIAPATFPLRPLRMFLGLCMVASVGLGIHMAQPWGDNYAYQDLAGYAYLAGFLAWAIAPLAALAWAAGWFRRSRRAWWLFALGAVCIAVWGTIVYVDASLVHLDAQGGLVFLFTPILQWAAALGLAAVCGLVQRFAP